MSDTKRQKIEFSAIDKDNLTDRYLELLKEKYIADQNDDVIEVLFKKDGSFSGHLWKAGCFYSNSDLFRNGDFEICEEDEERLCDFLTELEEENREGILEEIWSETLDKTFSEIEDNDKNRQVAADYFESGKDISNHECLKEYILENQ